MNYHLNFNLVWRHSDKLIDGLLLSLEIAAISIAIAMVIGLALALAYVDGNRWVRSAVSAYVEIIRNVPLLLLVYLMFYGLPTVVDIRYDPLTSFVATLSIYGGAYLVEVLRAGLQSVPQGLIEAGKAIGLTPSQRLVHVRLPTALRISLPSLSNTYVSLFKDTSIASVIAVPELAYAAQWINLNTFRIVEAYAVATPVYLVTGYSILFGLRLLERRYAIAR
jgi:polar amino acid transport system permease protein